MDQSNSNVSMTTVSGRVGLVLVLITMLIGQVGCWDIDPSSEPVDRHELVGTYAPTYETGGTERIMLRADSTYLHTYVTVDGQHFTQAGDWDIYYEQNRVTRPRIRFDNFINWYPMDGNCYSTRRRSELDTQPRDWGPYVRKQENGTIRIRRCPNVRQYYLKIE